MVERQVDVPRGSRGVGVTRTWQEHNPWQPWTTCASTVRMDAAHPLVWIDLVPIEAKVTSSPTIPLFPSQNAHGIDQSDRVPF